MDPENVKKLNIFERVALITAEIGSVAKDLKVGEGEKSYQATSEGSVLSAVKPLEEKYRVFSYATSREKETQIIEKEYTWNGQQRKIRLVKVDITATYRFVNIDKPDEYIETISYGTGLDTGDKAAGKAMTYADKYALMKTYKISTGNANDPDSYSSPDDGYIFGQFSDFPSEDNPLDYSPREEPRENMSGRETGTEEACTGETRMSLDEAKAVVLPIGEYKGRNMGEVLAIKPELIDFYASQKFNSSKYPYLKEAAQVILENQGA